MARLGQGYKDGVCGVGLFIIATYTHVCMFALFFNQGCISEFFNCGNGAQGPECVPVSAFCNGTIECSTSVDEDEAFCGTSKY